jgi:hypothetical protein
VEAKPTINFTRSRYLDFRVTAVQQVLCLGACWLVLIRYLGDDTIKIDNQTTFCFDCRRRGSLPVMKNRTFEVVAI